MDFTNTFHVQFDIKINLDAVAFIQSIRKYYDERATIFVVSSANCKFDAFEWLL